MICPKCVEAQGMMGQGEGVHGTCDWCQQPTLCYPWAFSNLQDPRRALNERLKHISTRRALLVDAVREFHSLTIERLKLLDEFARLDRMLTNKKVRFVSVAQVNKERSSEARVSDAIKMLSKMSDEERKALLAKMGKED